MPPRHPRDMSQTARLLALGLFCGVVTTTESIAAIPASESNALAALYTNTNGSGWTKRTGWLGASGTECTWFGVTCDAASGHVVGLSLPFNHLQGTLPEAISGLTALRTLDLHENFYLHGALPAGLGDLSALETVDLWSCGLSGPLPSELGQLQQLRVLQLADNGFTRPLPAAIFDLERLEVLNLSRNPLGAPGGWLFPSGLAELPHLRVLDLSFTGIAGELPAAIGSFPALEELRLSFGLAGGAIPAALADVHTLRVLDLSRLHFTSLPDLGALSNLQVLDVSGNGDLLAGPVPAWLGSLTSLRELRMAGTNRNGPFPDLPGLTELAVLDLQANPFDPGPIPTWIANLPELEVLDLFGTQRTGGFPDLSHAPGLRELDLDGNPLVPSPIPAWIYALRSLTLLDLSGTRRTGPLSAKIGDISTLEVLDLGSNRLTGTFPATLSKLSNLDYLYLQGNRITGAIQTSFSRIGCTFDCGVGLSGMDLRWNGLWTTSEDLADTLSFRHDDSADFRDTQTVAPTGVTAVASGPTSIAVTWEPILYASDPGYYEILTSRTARGPFQLALKAGGKLRSTATLLGLLPNTTYFIRVRSATTPHENNESIVLSAQSPTVSCKTSTPTVAPLAPLP